MQRTWLGCATGWGWTLATLAKTVRCRGSIPRSSIRRAIRVLNLAEINEDPIAKLVPAVSTIDEVARGELLAHVSPLGWEHINLTAGREPTVGHPPANDPQGLRRLSPAARPGGACGDGRCCQDESRLARSAVFLSGSCRM